MADAMAMMTKIWMAVLAFSVAQAVAGERTIDESLKLAGDNSEQIGNAIESVSDAQRDGMHFLVRYMPVGDLESLDSAMLVKNVELAYKARNMSEWATAVPNEIFLNDVLPYASLSEPREDWRSDFFARFSPMVGKCETLRDAVVVVNQAIRDELEVDYNTKRKRADQSPSESMEIKMASCTGLSILLVDAFRSVGIPARVAGTPSWTTKSGNHNWVEFFDPETGKWHFTEYYMDEKGIDHGWLLADAAKADDDHPLHAIYASSWKPTGHHFPLVWDFGCRDVAAAKVTARYVELFGDQPVDPKLCALRIDLTGTSGREAVEINVVVDGKVIGSGVTPGPTNDMHEFLVVNVAHGASYQVVTVDDGKTVHKADVPKEGEFTRVALKR